MSAFSLRKMRDPSRRAYLVHKKISSIEFFAFDFRYLCEYEDRLRFGIVKSETRFPFASALTFHYLCGAEGYRLSFS